MNDIDRIQRRLALSNIRPHDDVMTLLDAVDERDKRIANALDLIGEWRITPLPSSLSPEVAADVVAVVGKKLRDLCAALDSEATDA